MSKVSSTKSGYLSLSLSGIKASLDTVALQLLRGRFPNVDVETYYRMTETYIDETMRHSK